MNLLGEEVLETPKARVGLLVKDKFVSVIGVLPEDCG
jgi:hypothetical protein